MLSHTLFEFVALWQSHRAMAEEEPTTAVVGRIGCKVEAATDTAAATSAAAYTLSLAEPEEPSSPVTVYTDAVRGFDCGKSAGRTAGMHGVSARSAFSNASN